MTLKQFIAIMIVATVICWLSWTVVLFRIDPNESGLVGLLLFYASLFFSLVGTFFLVSFGWRKLFTKFSLDYRIVATSFRQSIFFALMIDGMLFLQSRGLLTWWNIILIVLALTIIEGLFLSTKRKL